MEPFLCLLLLLEVTKEIIRTPSIGNGWSGWRGLIQKGHSALSIHHAHGLGGIPLHFLSDDMILECGGDGDLGNAERTPEMEGELKDELKIRGVIRDKV
jgi:hypothetical protein